jgi:hypothetical protein
MRHAYAPRWWGVVVVLSTIAIARAQPDAIEEPPVEEPTFSRFQLHGFIGEGGFWSTDNDFIGTSSKGSLELFEVGLNVTTQLTDRLRAGAQLYGRAVGSFKDLPPGIDWAYLDYRWRDWLGLRAGVIKMPFGLYNEYADADSSRLSILMPQSVYPLRDRTALLSQTGFSLYGTQAIGGAGELEYQAWLGTLNVPANALELSGASLDAVNTRYVTGAQLFWRPPVDGLRLGGTYLRASIDFDVTFDPANIALLIMLGVVPADYDGKLRISQRPARVWVASAELVRDDWVFAAEYSRWYTRQSTTLPTVIPTVESDSERFYVLIARRICAWELGGYYAVTHADANDRQARDAMRFPIRHTGFQRDLAATVRYDVNEYWTWKLEGHFIDGTAELKASVNPDPKRYWGLFLFKTTVTF